MGLLEKISWKTRRWNLKVNLFDVFFHDGDGCWGFTILEVVKDFRPYSLFSFEFRLPNGADRRRFQITNWDFLFIATPLIKKINDINEDIIWGHKPTAFEKVILWIGTKMR